MKFAHWIAPVAFAALAVGLLAKGMVETSKSRIDPSTWLRFDAESKSFGTMPERTPLSLGFLVTNIGPRPLHILGSIGSCSDQGCVAAVKTTTEIAPGATSEVVVRFITNAPGFFVNDVTLFTDCPGRPQLPLVVTGTVLGPGAFGSVATLVR